MLTKGFDIESKPEDNAGTRMSYHRLGRGYTEAGNQKELPTCQCKDLEQPFGSSSEAKETELALRLEVSEEEFATGLPAAGQGSLTVLSSCATAGPFHDDLALKAAQAKPGARGSSGDGTGCWGLRMLQCCRAVVTQAGRDAQPSCRQRAESCLQIGGDSS